MAIKSSLVTCRASGTVKKYELTIPKNVSSSSFALNDKAKSYYSAIIKNYDNIVSYFTKISDEFNNIKTKAVNGDDLKKGIEKVAKYCKAQASACSNRKKDIKDGFKYAQLEAKFNELLEKFNKLASGK